MGLSNGMEMRMDRPRDLRRWAVVLILATTLVGACKDQPAEEEATSGAATVEAVEGTDTSRVTLTADAARRLDVQTAAVRADAAGTQIPYGAVLYDPSGDTWAFVNVEGRTFVRESIDVDHIEGDRAFLKDGPAVGAKVVTVGSAEIYGAELGVGDDE
jgi:hypothetical protein